MTDIVAAPHLASDERWVEGVLSHVGYKPGWTFAVLPADARYGDRVRLRIEAKAIDSVLWVTTGRELHSKVVSTVSVPPYFLHEKVTDHFIGWLRTEIRRLEMHELDEFFHDPKTTQLYHDPHANDQP